MATVCACVYAFVCKYVCVYVCVVCVCVCVSVWFALANYLRWISLDNKQFADLFPKFLETFLILFLFFIIFRDEVSFLYLRLDLTQKWVVTQQEDR